MSKIHRTQELTFEIVEGKVSLIAMSFLAESILYGKDDFEAGYFLVDILQQAGIKIDDDPAGNYVVIEEDGYISLWDSLCLVYLVD